MNNHPLYSNLLDYRGYSAFSTLPSKSTSLLPQIKTKPSFFSKLSFGKIGAFLGGAQKVLNIYNQVTPIIQQTKPLISNIKTTLKVAKAFKKFSKESSLEKAFDNLPDFDQMQNEKKEKPDEKRKIDFDYIDIEDTIKEDKKVPAPYFNVL